MSGERVRIRVVLAGASGETLAPLGEIDVADGDLLRIKLSPTGWSGWEARMRVESDHPLAAAQEPPADGGDR